MDRRDILTTCLAIGTVGLIGFVIAAALQYKQRNKPQYLLLIGSLLCEIIATFILVRLIPITNLLAVFFTVQGLVVCLCGLSIAFATMIQR
jgi:Zn-dependent protease with chaperone function